MSELAAPASRPHGWRRLVLLVLLVAAGAVAGGRLVAWTTTPRAMKVIVTDQAGNVTESSLADLADAPPTPCGPQAGQRLSMYGKMMPETLPIPVSTWASLRSGSVEWQQANLPAVYAGIAGGALMSLLLLGFGRSLRQFQRDNPRQNPPAGVEVATVLVSCSYGGLVALGLFSFFTERAAPSMTAILIPLGAAVLGALLGTSIRRRRGPPSRRDLDEVMQGISRRSARQGPASAAEPVPPEAS